ncbi:MAG: 5'-methylthioadenosine/S-adenosylhomocysteine nucleosidase [Lewinellaceae bacterium]|nr:5'-methylthioadenosine/S-adenosylhomocysteine nucleosidase [Lewinellaceae bacterium]
MSRADTPIRIVILTPIRVEYESIRKHIPQIKREVIEGVFFETGLFSGANHDYEVFIQETGSKNTIVALASEKAIRLLNPAIIILVGIAGGVKDVQIGDVVIGTKAYGYESGKEEEQGPKSRPEVLSYSKELIEAARVISRDDEWRKRIEDSATSARVFFGPIASGDKVIASTATPLYQFLKQHYNDTIALEMESIGFAQAVSPYRRIHALNIRGISDLLDHKSGIDENSRQYMAANRAAAFLSEFLYQLDCSPFLFTDMDVKSIAKELYSLFFPAAFQEVGKDFTDAINGDIRAIWEKVKPFFIKDDAFEALRQDPEDSAAQGVLEMKLRRVLEQDADLLKSVVDLVYAAKQTQHSGGAGMETLDSKNVVQGGVINMDGDFRIGDDVINQTVNNKGDIGKITNIGPIDGDVNIW